MHWRELPPLAQAQALPRGIPSIAQHIQAPPQLARALSQIGLVDNAGAGESAAAALQPGQIIVSRDGWAWRWDGYTVTPQAKTTTAIRMRQRNRLVGLEREITEAEADAARYNQRLEEATNVLAEKQIEDRTAREDIQSAFAAVNDALSAFGTQEKESAAVASKLLSHDETLRQICNGDLGANERTRALTAEAEQDALPDFEALRAEIAMAREHLAERRTAQAKCQSECDRLSREQALFDERNAALLEESEAWRSRLANAAQQIESLLERVRSIEAQLLKLQMRPAELAAQRARLLNELSEAEAKRKTAADQLIETEHKLNLIEHQLKQDEAALGLAREERVRAEGAVEAASEHFNTLRERMIEKLNCSPEELVGNRRIWR